MSCPCRRGGSAGGRLLAEAAQERAGEARAAEACGSATAAHCGAALYWAALNFGSSFKSINSRFRVIGISVGNTSAKAAFAR